MVTQSVRTIPYCNIYVQSTYSGTYLTQGLYVCLQLIQHQLTTQPVITDMLNCVRSLESVCANN